MSHKMRDAMYWLKFGSTFFYRPIQEVIRSFWKSEKLVGERMKIDLNNKAA